MLTKNVNKVIPLWEKTKSHYLKTTENDLSGFWENESYRIEIYQSGDQLVGFIETVINGDASWSKNQLKMIFRPEKGMGVYLMGIKTPIPSKFKVNKFGHLEITLLTNFEKFSFAKSNKL